jgi:hypothetical protein
LFDGSRSTFRMGFLNCGGYWYLQLNCLFDGTKVRDWMKRNKAAAVNQPALRGLGHLLSFFDPRYVCTSGAAQVLNEANLFHEGLHGFF